MALAEVEAQVRADALVAKLAEAEAQVRADALVAKLAEAERRAKETASDLGVCRACLIVAGLRM